MAFIDEMTVHIRAGRGGNGVVRWLHEKFKEFGGPSGGDGGRGGHVYARAVRDTTLLARYKNIKEFNAQNGEAGGKNSKHGANGEDMYLELPVGSVITNKSTREVFRLDTEGQDVLLLKGGNGGLGNERFKSSTNQTPEEWTPGKNGGEADFYIEVELIANAGLIGLPNAGKSSLLNALTEAHAKVGAYQFTTLEPNLGAMYGYILADIPGLIEGASEGRGLGHKFLRHIKRTKVLLHCISLEQSVDEIAAAYSTIRNELESYSPDMASKPEIIILTKTDVRTPAEMDEKVEAIKKKMKEWKNLHVLTVSVYDLDSLKRMTDFLTKVLGSNEISAMIATAESKMKHAPAKVVAKNTALAKTPAKAPVKKAADKNKASKNSSKVAKAVKKSAKKAPAKKPAKPAKAAKKVAKQVKTAKPVAKKASKAPAKKAKKK